MDKTQKFAAYFTEDQKVKIDRCQDLDGSRSAAEVVRRAVDFYHAYLTAGDAGPFLPQAVQSYLDGRLGMFEDRMASLMYKQLVEIDMTNGIIATAYDIGEDVLRHMRAQSVRNVKETNGRISFEQRMRDAGDE
ncbi:MAG: hypothetical protein VB055_10980 [Oscillospiraceae bacterium]|nr:hypothetical protein [Oscillospiraceae bacterium]